MPGKPGVKRWYGHKVFLVCKCSVCDQIIARQLTLADAGRVMAGETLALCPTCRSNSRWKVVEKEVIHADMRDVFP